MIEGPNARNKVAFGAFHSFFVEVQIKLATHLPGMRNSNLEIRFTGSSCRPQWRCVRFLSLQKRCFCFRVHSGLPSVARLTLHTQPCACPRWPKKHDNIAPVLQVSLSLKWLESWRRLSSRNTWIVGSPRSLFSKGARKGQKTLVRERCAAQKDAFLFGWFSSPPPPPQPTQPFFPLLCSHQERWPTFRIRLKSAPSS